MRILFVISLFLLPSFSFSYEQLLLIGVSSNSNYFVDTVNTYGEKEGRLALKQRVQYIYDKGNLVQKRFFNHHLSLSKLEDYRYLSSGTFLIEGITIPDGNRIYKKKYHHSGHLLDKLEYSSKKILRTKHKILISEGGKLLKDSISYNHSRLRETKVYEYGPLGNRVKMLWTSSRPSKTTHYFSETKEKKQGWYFDSRRSKKIFLNQELVYEGDRLNEIKGIFQGKRRIVQIKYAQN